MMPKLAVQQTERKNNEKDKLGSRAERQSVKKKFTGPRGREVHEDDDGK